MLRCWICLKPGENHHIRTRGAGGGNEPTNVIPLCREHHTEIHKKGVRTMTQIYKLPIDTSGIYPKRTDI